MALLSMYFMLGDHIVSHKPSRAMGLNVRSLVTKPNTALIGQFKWHRFYKIPSVSALFHCRSILASDVITEVFFKIILANSSQKYGYRWWRLCQKVRSLQNSRRDVLVYLPFFQKSISLFSLTPFNTQITIGSPRPCDKCNGEY